MTRARPTNQRSSPLVARSAAVVIAAVVILTLLVLGAAPAGAQDGTGRRSALGLTLQIGVGAVLLVIGALWWWRRRRAQPVED